MSEKFLTTKHRFLIFRHGLATLSTTGYGDQIYSAKLLPQGIPAVERLAKFLANQPTDFNFVSPVLRCQQTAQIVTDATGKTFETDQRLNEYNDETFAQLGKRIEDFLEEKIAAAETFTNEDKAIVLTFLICTHGAVIAGLKNFLLKNEFLPADEMDFTQPGELLEIAQGKSTITSFN
jgi:broad specificity phosphatase PhoE